LALILELLFERAPSLPLELALPTSSRQQSFRRVDMTTRFSATPNSSVKKLYRGAAHSAVGEGPCFL
jgi:hypothetical protein